MYNIIQAMKTTINYELSDYMKIAALVNDNASDESSTYEVEYTTGGHTLIIEVKHEIEYRDEIGGSYENYDFERLTVVDNEEYDVVGAWCYDSEGDEINSDFNAKRILDILN